MKAREIILFLILSLLMEGDFAYQTLQLQILFRHGSREVVLFHSKNEDPKSVYVSNFEVEFEEINSVEGISVWNILKFDIF